MSASDHLNPVQFMPVHEVSKMHSGDYDEPMSRMHSLLRQEWSNYLSDREAPDDDPGDYGIHHKDIEHGGPDKYVTHLATDFKKRGMQEPLKVRGGNVVTDGHHRYAAAVQAGLTQIPVRHFR